MLHGLGITLRGLPKGAQRRKVKIDGDVVAHLSQLACSGAPGGYADWPLRLLADRAVELNYVGGISHRGVVRLAAQKKNEIKPWKREMWVIPQEQNAGFVYQMGQVPEVYKRPYDPGHPRPAAVGGHSGGPCC